MGLCGRRRVNKPQSGLFTRHYYTPVRQYVKGSPGQLSGKIRRADLMVKYPTFVRILHNRPEINRFTLSALFL